MSPRPSVEPGVAFGNGSITIVSDEFGTDRRGVVAALLSRAFAVPEVASVAVRLADRSVTIEGSTTTRLVAALRDGGGSIPPAALPPIGSAESFVIRRHGSILTRCRVLSDRPGSLRLGVDGLRGDAALADRLARALGDKAKLATIPPCSWTGVVVLRYDAGSRRAESLIRIVDEALAGPIVTAELAGGEPVKFGPANTSLALATIGEFLLPVVNPLCALLLVVSNIDTFRSARDQIRKRELGLPVLYSTIVGATLVAGQFVPSALMTWLFKFWRRRHRMQLAIGRDRLIAEHLPAARLARRDADQALEVFVDAEQLRSGDRILARAGEILPADGVVVAGEGVVDERRVMGLDGVSRKRIGDHVPAGSLLLAGELRVEVERAGEGTRASSLRRALIQATGPSSAASPMPEHSERFAAKAVGPTLAAAGVGLLAGDIATAAAILRPDYATGPGLAVPLEALADVDRCVRRGILLREADALRRLAEIDLLVVEDQPALRRSELEVTKIHTRLSEDLVIRFAAGLHRHLHDARAGALAAAARSRGVPIPRLEPSDYHGGVGVDHEGRRVRVREHLPDGGIMGPLAVEIDDVLVGLIEFRASVRSTASTAFNRVRELSGVPIVLLSDQPAPNARALGIDLRRGGLAPESIVALLRDCRARGLRVGYVGHGRARPHPAAEAFVAITLGSEGGLEDDPAAIQIPQPDPSRLAALWETSRGHVARQRDGRRLILLPNLICVAGAFFLGFNGLTSVLVSNIGTYSLFRRSNETLRSLDGPKRPRGSIAARTEDSP